MAKVVIRCYEQEPNTFNDVENFTGPTPQFKYWSLKTKDGRVFIAEHLVEEVVVSEEEENIEAARRAIAYE